MKRSRKDSNAKPNAFVSSPSPPIWGSLQKYKALLQRYRTLLQKYKALLQKLRALWWKYKVLLEKVCKFLRKQKDARCRNMNGIIKLNPPLRPWGGNTIPANR